MPQDLSAPCFSPSGRCNLTAPCPHTCALHPTVHYTHSLIPNPALVYVSPAARHPSLATRADLEDRIDAQAAEIARLRAERDDLRTALQEADTIMGHDDSATEWRDEWAPLFRMPDDAAREST